MKKTISLDFDGVIHSYEAGWTGYAPEGEPIPGSVEFVKKLIANDYEVIISSCRAYTQIGREGIRDWLNKHGFPRLDVTCEKPHAVVYLDDRAVRFEGCFEQAWVMLNQEVWFKVGKEPDLEKAG